MQDSIRTLSPFISGLLLSPLRPGNVVMFHIGRSGSTVLGDLLGQHPNIFWDGEIYHRYSIRRNMKRLPKGMAHYLARNPIKFLRLKMFKAGNRFYGFETKYYDLQAINVKLPDFIEHLQNLKFNHFIILERRNYLRKFVSAIIGRKQGFFHLRHGESPSLTQIELDVDNLLQVGPRPNPKSLISHLQEHQGFFLTLKQLLDGQNVLHLTYEDDISANPLIGYQCVCDFLGIEKRESAIRFSRTNPFNLTEMIINFDEVEHALRGSQFEWMLYE